MKKMTCEMCRSNDLIKQNNNSVGKIALFIFCLFIIFPFTACSNDNNISRNSTNENPNRSSTSSEQTDSESSEQTDEEDTDNTECNNTSVDKIIVKRSAQVVKNFHVISGAVIYRQTYDEYGYPDCCYFSKKCDFCGNVGENGSARGNITSGYTCPKCKKTNRVEIKADFEWIEVND